jgi:hypothetical protein
MTGLLPHQWPLPKVEPILAAASFDFLIKAATRVPPAPHRSHGRGHRLPTSQAAAGANPSTGLEVHPPASARMTYGGSTPR